MHDVSLVKGIFGKWGQSTGNSKFPFSIIMRYCILYLPHVNEEVMVAASRELTTMKGASSEDEINTWRKAE